MIFADTDWGAWSVTIATLLGGGVVWLVAALTAKRKTTISEWQSIAENERELRYRSEAKYNNLEASFRRMFTLYSDARSRSVDFYSIMCLQQTVIKRLNVKVMKAGQEGEDGLDLPPRPTDASHVEADFLVNTVAQEKISASSIAQTTPTIKSSTP